MSAFRPSGGAGSGISAAQLDGLQSDAEATAQTGSINSTTTAQGGLTRAALAAAQDSVENQLQFIQDYMGTISAEVLAVGSTVSALGTTVGTVSSTVAAVNTTVSALNTSVGTLGTTVSAVNTAVAASAPSAGDMKLVNRASGLASAGWTKAGGVGVPDNFFNVARTVVLPYQQGASAMSSYSAAYGQRTTLGDKFYVTSALAFRAVDMGTAAWSNLPAVVSPGSSATPSVVGTVNGKVMFTGYQVGSVSFASVYTYDPVTSAHSLRAANPGGYRGFSGVADIGSGQAVLFGGKTVAENTATTATNIVNEVRVYSDTPNGYTSKPNLPVNMAYVRTATRSDNKVYLLPAATSDGVTLNSASRRVFLYDVSAGTTVELDPLPAEVSTSAWLVHVKSDNTLVYVPTTPPSSGQRARVMNPASSATLQWTGIDWDYNDLATYVALPQSVEAKASASGFMLSGMVISTLGNVAPTATYVGGQAANWSQSFYQIKN